MKLITVFAIFITFFSCTVHKRTVAYIPLEYNFPGIKVGESVTYIYVDQSNGDSSFYNFHHYAKNKKSYFAFTSSDGKRTMDSMVYLDGKLMEHFSYLFDKPFPTKGIILLDTLIDTGKKFGKQITQINFSSDSLVDSVGLENEYLKDTVFTWQGATISTVEVKTTLFTAFKSKFNTNIEKDFTVPLISYQAKGIGTIRIKILKTVDNRTKNIDLIQIKK